MLRSESFSTDTGHDANPRGRRIFLLSPANIGGARAKLLLRESAGFPLAKRLRSEGAQLGEVFSFISGLYFRGKLAYARAHANPPPGIPGVVIITAAGGLLCPEKIVTLRDLVDISAAPIDANVPRYRVPLERDARILSEAIGTQCEAILLGSIATPKYVEPLGGIFGSSLMFPADFLGRGDMSRGSLMLRCVREAVALRYLPVTSLSLVGDEKDDAPEPAAAAVSRRSRSTARSGKRERG